MENPFDRPVRSRFMENFKNQKSKMADIGGHFGFFACYHGKNG